MENQFKGTKGKWIIDHEESGYNKHHVLATPISRIDPSYPIITGLCDIYGDDEEAKANALLISKAPEMLEMLEKLVERLEENDLGKLHAVTKAKQLIKEATEI